MRLSLFLGLRTLAGMILALLLIPRSRYGDEPYRHAGALHHSKARDPAVLHPSGSHRQLQVRMSVPWQA